MTELLGSLLIVMMLAVMAARTVAPLSAPVRGDHLADVRIGPFFRLLDQRINVIAIFVALVLGSGFLGERWISHGTFLFAFVVMIGILLIPSRYRFTTEGVSPNRSTFRGWNEFHEWRASGNVIWLQGDTHFSSLKLYVAESDRAAINNLLDRFLPAAVAPEPRLSPARTSKSRESLKKGGSK